MGWPTLRFGRRRPGTPFGEVPGFGRAHADEGLIVYLEVAESVAPAAARMLHHLKLASWFEHANAVLLGRTGAGDGPGYTPREALHDTVGALDIPVFCDLDLGHVPPQGILVNGALAHVCLDGPQGRLLQQPV